MIKRILKSYRVGMIRAKLKFRLIELFKKDYILLNSFLPIRAGRVGIHNFGDDLNIHLVEHLSGKRVVPIQYSGKKSITRDNYICIGSYLHNSNSNSIIWGTGAIENSLPKGFDFKQICAVRGPLTRNLLISNGFDCPQIFGDPALLLPTIYTPKVEKRYKFGIIPHIVDKSSPQLEEASKGKNITIIDIQHDSHWHSFIDKICECEIILSSSLHGLIIADAYNIPNVWCEFSGELIGKHFKFNDYFLSVQRDTIQPIIIKDKIDFSMVQESAKKWRPIIFDPHKLISVAPFKIDDAKIMPV